MIAVGAHVFVTLDQPILILLSDEPHQVMAVEGEVVDANVTAVEIRSFRLLRVYPKEQARFHFVTMRATVDLPMANIRGLMVLPKREKQ